MEKKTKIITALATILALLVIIYFLMPYNIKVVHIINKTYVSQANSTNYTFVYNSIPIKITQNSLFGNTSNIKGIMCENKTYVFYIQKTSNMSVLYNGFYVPTYIILEGNYYKSNLTLRGLSFTGSDYIPSLIGKRVSLLGSGNTNPNVNPLFAVSYFVKSENIQGNEVVWNLTFDGNVNNAIKIPFSKTTTLNSFYFGNDSGIFILNKYFSGVSSNVC